MKKAKLFLDEDIHAVLGSILRKRGFDAKHAQELERKGKSDVEQLSYSVEQKRCLISFNVKDYVQLHNQYVNTGLEHWGIIVSKQIPIGETLSRLLIVLGHASQTSLKNRLLFLKQPPME